MANPSLRNSQLPPWHDKNLNSAHQSARIFLLHLSSHTPLPWPAALQLPSPMMEMPSRQSPREPSDDVYSPRVCHVASANQRSVSNLFVSIDFGIKGWADMEIRLRGPLLQSIAPTLMDGRDDGVSNACRGTADEAGSVMARRRSVQHAQRSTRLRATTMLRAKAGGPSHRPRLQLVLNVKLLPQLRHTQGDH